MNDDYYKILGVAPSASQADIKARFRFLSHAYHPDKFSTDGHKKEAEEEFKRINSAYQVLSKPNERARYDASHTEASSQEQSSRRDTKPAPHIIIRRGTSYADRLRAYKVVVDDVVVATLRAGKSVTLPVTPGSHRLQLRIDWCGSEELLFDAQDGAAIEFECGSGLAGQRRISALAAIFRRTQDYLWLRRAA
ncbi:MAG: DnaJ domain-containing protein [Verrucomicrobiota bacterium]|jgi:curved DNA-binding protein CbpA